MTVITAEERRRIFRQHLSGIKDFSEKKKDVPEEVAPLVSDIAGKITDGIILNCSAEKLIFLLSSNFNEDKAGPSDLHYINSRLAKILRAVQ